jgi:hypothetical protein
MKIEIMSQLKETSIRYVGENFYELFEVSFDYLPYLGSLLQARKINRAQRRIQEFAPQLEMLTFLNGLGKLPDEFVQEKIGPIVFSDFIEEHEDAKITYLLNGFQNVFLEEKIDESLIYNYFDTLRALRYADLRRFNYHAGIDVMYPIKEQLTNDEYITFARRMDLKLKNMTLIHVPIRFGEFDGMEYFEEDAKFELLSYGKSFKSFINISN